MLIFVAGFRVCQAQQRRVLELAKAGLNQLTLKKSIKRPGTRGGVNIRSSSTDIDSLLKIIYHPQ